MQWSVKSWSPLAAVGAVGWDRLIGYVAVPAAGAGRTA